MLQGLEYVQETINLRSQDIQGNRIETNNMLMDDILLALGYNKRREKGITPVYDSDIDWEISVGEDNRFVISVIGYGDTIPTRESIQSLHRLKDSNYRFLVITDGKKISIHNTSREIVRIKDIFNNDSDEALTLLSNDGWNPDKLEKFNSDVAIDSTDVSKILFDISTFEHVLNKLNIHINDSTIEIIGDTINNIVNNGNCDDTQLIELRTELEYKNKRIEELEVLLNSDADIDDANKKREFADALKMNSELEQEVNSLKKELDTLKQVNADSVGYAESAYRTRIVELISENQELKDKITDLTKKLEEIIKKQDGAEDAKVVMARQLLDAVEDNPDLTRTYVGVVNSKLFQINDLPKFTGVCIQELYSIVSFDLMQLLFDGDVFKVIQPATRGDLMINTKQYDIDISMLSEDEVLSRLKTLFGKFDKVIFMCKTIGTHKATAISDRDLSDLENLVFNLDGTAEIAETDIFGERMDFVKQLDNTENEEDDEVESTEPLLGLALCDVMAVMWEKNSPIRNIRAIGDSESIFKIKNKTLENVLLYGIRSLISLSNNIYSSINKLSSANLSEYSGFVSIEKQSDSAVNIPYTHYYVELDRLQKCVSMLIMVADVLGLDDTDIYLYMEAAYVTDGDLVNNYIDRESLGLNERVDRKQAAKVKYNIHCMISGKEYYTSMNTEDMSYAIDRMIIDTVAIRTQYIKSSIRSLEDLAGVISTMVNMVGTDKAEELIENINNELGNGKQLIKTSTEGLTGKEIELKIGNKTYYLGKIQAGMVLKLLFKLHSLVSDSDVIDMRVAVDSQLYTIHKDKAITADCYEYLTGKLFVELTEGKTRNILK